MRTIVESRADRTRVIAGVKRISRAGLRVYARKTEIPRVVGGLGIAVLSTAEGVMSGRQALRQGLGGEVLCYVWQTERRELSRIGSRPLRARARGRLGWSQPAARGRGRRATLSGARLPDWRPGLRVAT